MILKFFVPHNDEESWGYIEGIKEVYSRQSYVEPIIEKMKNIAEVARLEDCIDRTAEDKPAYLFCCHVSDGKVFFLAANRSVFLLNNQGQTIERLV